MAAQFELFSTEAPVARREPAPTRRQAVHVALSEEEMAARLVATGRYRILKKLEPWPVLAPRPDYPLRGVILDTETTGLDHRTHEIIEIGLIAFSFNDRGEIGEVTGLYGGLQQPSIPIPADITRITGITDALVAGKSIDLAEVERLVAPADLVIAHNAGFDRPFCERFSGLFDGKAWACSNAEIDWTVRGYEGTKLGYLVGQSGYFHDGHRAVEDCFALLEVLARGKGDQPPFAELHAASQRCRMRIFAESAPFEMKDHLKARGYRWSDGSSGIPKCWWTEVAEELLEEELHYLRTEVYRWRDADPSVRRLTAFDRFRA
jgi:DNA polymerase-3 subunit epsilon